VKRFIAGAIFATVVLVAVMAWHNWKRRQEMLRELDRQGKVLQCMKQQSEIRIAEINCTIDLTDKGQARPKAARYCHYQHTVDWQNWAKGCPDMAKQILENHAIVEATE
jgi:hypothetical protein